MNKKTIAKIRKIVESIGWNIEVDKNEFMFSKYSPAGQDFNITIEAESMEELIKKTYERYNNFDCSEETYLWLDESGHGKNGAPYDMKDLYEDMEVCQQMILGLHEELSSSLNIEE